MEWKVGTRYRLEKVLGYGSFSCVVLAVDTETDEYVALKRIGNVLYSEEQAKRVLREISILRRVNHPNIIGLTDAFVRPSATGQCRLVNGKLVNLSIDLYIATEYANGGDLFHMMGQLSQEEVASILWQLIQATSYLHSLHVWHRDVKSQNCFLVWQNGERVVKLGDMGSARSAITNELEHGLLVEDRLDGQCCPGRGRVALSPGQDQLDASSHLHAAQSYMRMDEAIKYSDFVVEPSDKGGFKAPLTRVVATPCYRAPEVVMSRGGYTEAIDMWGIGCIFGEILQRVAYVGSASTPNLQVAPLFALKELPKTPSNGETFGHPECEITRRELEALFKVVGTPAWQDFQAVEMPEWRKYLSKLPGQAPKLYRKFKAAGEVAVHLLSRLLEFDPKRRAGCEEALSHEFFADIRDSIAIEMEEEVLVRENMDSLMIDAAAAAATNSAVINFALDGDQSSPFTKDMEETSPSHVAQEENPGKALALLEMHVEQIVAATGENSTTEGPPSEKLKMLLEAECRAVQQGQVASRHRDVSPVRLPKSTRTHKSSGLLEDSAAKGELVYDYGRERLSNVADTRQGSELDPTKFLGPHRHGEWSAQTFSGQAPEGPRWGVTSLPPGFSGAEEDPRIKEILKNQQGR
jgi:mitogen-activated protein kinase 1/3